MAATQPLAAQPRERAWIVATLMVGTMSTLLSATIVNVAFPALIAEMHIGHDVVQWVATGFLAATTATMLGTAWALQRFGERTTYIVTLSVFLAGSLLGAFAWSANALIFARVMQGAAAGVLQPLAMVVLFRVFPVSERGRAMGIYGFGIVLAPAIGPAIGGALVTNFGWRWIFVLSLPFCVAGILLARKTLVDRVSGERPHFDTVGFVLLVLGLIAALNVPVVGHREGWTSVALAAIAAVASALWIAFVVWELRAAAPMLSMRLFRHRAFRSASMVALAYGVGLFGSTYLLPVFVQEIAHYSAASAGSLMVIPGLALAVSIAIGGRLTDRFEPRFVMIGGCVLFAISSVLFVWTGDGTRFWVFVAWILVGRIGLGLLIPALNVGAVQSLTGNELAYASSAVNFLRQLGGAAGVNLLAVYLEQRLHVLDAAQAPRAFHECFLLVAIAFAVAVVPAWFARRTGS